MCSVGGLYYKTPLWVSFSELTPLSVSISNLNSKADFIRNPYLNVDRHLNYTITQGLICSAYPAILFVLCYEKQYTS